MDEAKKYFDKRQIAIQKGGLNVHSVHYDTYSETKEEIINGKKIIKTTQGYLAFFHGTV